MTDVGLIAIPACFKRATSPAPQYAVMSSEELRQRVPAVVMVVLAFLAVAAAVFGAIGNYVVFDRPVTLGTAATALVVTAGRRVFGTDFRRWTTVLVLGWMCLAIHLHFTAFDEFDGLENVPSPAGTGVEATVLIYNGFKTGPWKVVIRKDEGWWTREQVVLSCDTDSGGWPDVYWIDSAHLVVPVWEEEQVFGVDPVTGQLRTRPETHRVCTDT
ncbi:hypothetical protein ACIBF6_45180 [Streptosporangium amethystogenes]|uniref:hypothetical protein n=1 Tax=Streptosporangium amethystogenes TaxID=2002 RepID=UPI0037AC4968